MIRVATALALCSTSIAHAQSVDWPCVGNDRGCARYSTLDQIDRSNVDQLEVAWSYSTGELERGGKIIECTPLVVGGTMYVTTAYLRVIALDAATGEERWTFDPFEGEHPGYPLASGGVNRGLAYWSDGNWNGERRIIHGSADGRVFSLDALTGTLDPEFADGGVLDLRKGIDRDLARMGYGPTSAANVFDDIVIFGFSTGEGPGPAAPGDVRAFDVRTGEEVWRFHTVPLPGEFGHDTWGGESWKNRGGANAWGGISVDDERGLVFFGLGSAAFDFYGGDRPGANLFANCVVCLDARTGERRWHFQTLRHDLWDHDLPIYPNLIDITTDGVTRAAVAQVTKTGHVFLFDRETGAPLFEIREHPAPPSDVPGEEAWPSQPVPVKPPPFARTVITEDDLTDISPEAHAAALEQYRAIRAGAERFLPPSERGTLVVPGFHGGATWSGASFDPTSNVLFVNTNELPNIITLKKAPEGRRYAYGITGYNQFKDSEGYPAVKPPWGELVAIDVAKGEIVWRTVLGEFAELTARGIPQTGTESFGGTIATAGGLVFIGGTMDEMFHAFDSATGELLWQTKLPAGGYATPCTYMIDGRQYVAIAASGAGKLKTKPGDEFVVFALPSDE